MDPAEIHTACRYEYPGSATATVFVWSRFVAYDVIVSFNSRTYQVSGLDPTSKPKDMLLDKLLFINIQI